MTTNLHHTAGRLAVAAAVLCLVGGMTHPIVDGNAHSVDSLLAPASPWAQYALLGGTILLLAALPGLHARFADRLGRLGAIGFALYFVGNATCAMAHLIVEAMVARPLAQDAVTARLVPADGSLFDGTAFVLTQMVGGPVLLVGELLIGIAVVRGRGLPTWAGWLMAVGAVAMFLPWPEIAVFSGVLLELPRGLGIAALGLLALRTRPEVPVEGDREPVLA